MNDPQSRVQRAQILAMKGERAAVLAEIDGILAELDAGSRRGDEAELRDDLANLMHQTEDPREAAQLTKVVSLFQTRGETARLVAPCLRLAQLNVKSAATALYWADRAITAAERSGDAQLAMRPLAIRGELLMSLGRAEEALALLSKAVNLTGGNIYVDILATAQIAAGHAQEGIETLQKSLAEAERGADEPAAAQAVNLRVRLSDAWRSLGNRRRALEILEGARARAPQLREGSLYATFMDRLGSAQLESGDLVGAARTLEMGLDRLRKDHADDAPNTASLYINLGNALAALGMHEGAVRSLSEGVRATRGLDPRSESRALFGLANAATKLGDLERAHAAYEEACGLAVRLEDRSLEAACLDSLGQLRVREHQPAKAIDLHRRAAQMHAEAGDPRGQSTDLLNLVQAFLQLRDTAPARRAFDEARAIAKANSWQPTWEQLLCHGQILAAEENWPQARVEFEAAIAELESQRAALATPADQRDWAQHRVEGFEIATAAAFEAGDAHAAWQFLEGNRTRFLEMVSERRRRLPVDLPEEIRSAYTTAADRLAALRRRRRERPDIPDASLEAELAMAERDYQELDADVIRARGHAEDPATPALQPVDAESLAIGETAVALHSTPDWIGAACVGRGRDGQIWWACETDRRVSLEDLSRAVVGLPLRDGEDPLLSWQDLNRLPIAHAESLVAHTCDWLSGALWPLIERVVGDRADVIVLMPGRGLNVLPLHAAVTSNGRLAMDRWAIRYAPSLRLFTRTNPRVLPSARVLGQVVNPTGDLPFTPPESQAIRSKWRGQRAAPLEGAAARVEPVLALFEKTDVLHYAGHGSFDPDDPLQSCLLCAPGKSDGALTLHTLLNEMPSVRTQVVLLSACETGRVLAADVLNDQLGLPGGLLIAGAGAVLATFWRVNDLASCLTLSRCIENWEKDTTDLDRALAQAQAWLRDEVTVAVARDWIEEQLQAAGEDLQLEAAYGRLVTRNEDELLFASPLYWAAFHITGRAVRLQ